MSAHNHGSDTGQIMVDSKQGARLLGIGTVSSAEEAKWIAQFAGNTGGGTLARNDNGDADSGGVYGGSWCPEAIADAPDGQ